jgi:hypothetical protein
MEVNMGLFDTKNDHDNRNYADGYKTGRGSEDPASYVATNLLRGFFGKEWNAGYEQGTRDAEKFGKKD